MDPGTVFLLENQSKLGHAQNPYIAVMSCPRCGTRDTREISRFGSTPCKAQWQCRACLEPFDRFKSI